MSLMFRFALPDAFRSQPGPLPYAADLAFAYMKDQLSDEGEVHFTEFIASCQSALERDIYVTRW